MMVYDMTHASVMKQVETDSNLLFMPGLFHETMQLVSDSYEYFQLQESLGEADMPPHLRTLLANEMSRITMRLTSVMAWLMARKAVSSGQLSDDEACAEYRIDGAELCLEYHDEYAHMLPDYLNALLDTSYHLYRRVWRLDHQLYGARDI